MLLEECDLQAVTTLELAASRLLFTCGHQETLDFRSHEISLRLTLKENKISLCISLTTPYFSANKYLPFHAQIILLPAHSLISVMSEQRVRYWSDQSRLRQQTMSRRHRRRLEM